MQLLPYIAISGIVIGAGILVFIVLTAIPARADAAALLAPSTEEQRVRVERGSLADALEALVPGGYLGWVQRKITYAGRTGQWSVGGFLSAKLVLLVIAAAVVFAALVSAAGPFMTLLGVAFGLLLLVAPEVVLSSRAADRQSAIRLALPDTLDQMTIAVEAGLGFESAMAKAARGSSGPLSDELVRTLQDMSIGRSRFDAYGALLARTECDDLKRFIRAVQQADRYGIGIADVLRVQASEMRIKRRQRAEEQAMKVPIKVVFPLVFAILPVLFIVLLFPAVLSIFRVFSGL